MPLSIEEMKAKIDLVRFNPSAICQVALDVLEEVNTGTRLVVDPTNPFMFLLEASAVNASAAMSAFADHSRKQYGVMAQDEDEIYMHMSDKDFLGRFGNPSTTTITMLLSLDEVKAKAVQTELTNMRKIVIPRHTTFTVAGHSFMMQYPIELRVMSHGGINILHDVSRKSPFMNLETNVVQHEIVNIDGTVFICLNIPVLQLESIIYYPKVSSGVLTEALYPLNGQFYYARVYRLDERNEWVEMRTTHSDQVYDPVTPTAVIKVYQNTVKVSVPLVYQANGMVTRELRVEIYTTDGELSLILNNYPPNAYGATWLDYDNDDNGVYTAPLKSFNAVSVYSDAVVAGGTNALTFDQVRERLISTSMGDQQLPITSVQLGSTLADAGFSAVVNTDFVTNRQILATRTLPTPSDMSIYTGMASTIGMLQCTADELRTVYGVYDNDGRLTITPKVLYQNDSVLKIVPGSVIENLEDMRNTDIFIQEVGGKNYLWTPFYYVWDLEGDYFTTRAYHLDAPDITSKAFVEENPSLGLVVSTQSYAIEKVETGYRVVVTTVSGSAYKEIDLAQRHVVLSFEAPNENGRASLPGTLLYVNEDTGEASYEFLLETNYDITDDDLLIVTNFSIFGQVQPCGIRLKDKLTLVYGVSNYLSQDMVFSDIDKITDTTLVPASHYAIIQEELNFVLGYALNNLWTNSRTVVGSEGYLRYDVDVPAVYESTQYKRDPVTGSYVIRMVNDLPDFEILHNIGDPVIVNGVPQLAHRKGELVLDSDGNPIVESPRKVTRQVDLFLVDGLYYFADDDSTVEYTKSIPNIIVGWLENDIAAASKKMLELTELYYYPQRTTGYVDALVLEGFEVRLEVEQALSVELYMTKAGYEDLPLRASLEDNILEIIADELGKETVRCIDIENRIVESAKDQVITAVVNGLGGSQNYRVVTLTDLSARFGIRKKLQALADGTYSVVDDVAISFLRHTNA